LLYIAPEAITGYHFTHPDTPCTEKIRIQFAKRDVDAFISRLHATNSDETNLVNEWRSYADLFGRAMMTALHSTLTHWFLGEQ